MKTIYEFYIPEHGMDEDSLETFKTFEEDYEYAAVELCEVNFAHWDYHCPGYIMFRKRGDVEFIKIKLHVVDVPLFEATRVSA